MSDFRLTSFKTLKIFYIISASWCCAAPLFIQARSVLSPYTYTVCVMTAEPFNIQASIKGLSQIMSFNVYVEKHAKIKFCVKLSIMPTQTNVKMTAAHVNYRVSRKLFFK